jgi:hypothetical protein
MSDSSFFLSWRGRQTGPYSLQQIQELMGSGDISGLHLVMHHGKWMMVDEFLAAVCPALPPPQPLRPMQPVESTAELAVIADKDETVPAAKLEDESEPPIVPVRVYPATETTAPPYYPQGPAVPRWAYYGVPPAAHPPRTNGMAVAAFVGSIACLFFTLVWPIALLLWLVSLILGHVAISSCNHDLSLRGKGLAVAAVSICYLLLLLFVSLGVLIAVRNS